MRIQVWNTEARYGVVGKFFHWTIALLIIALICVGLYMTRMPLSPRKLYFYRMHKSFGIAVLALAALRLVWKWRNIQPVLPPSSLMERWSVHAGHGLLYLLMFAQPLSGWLMSSALGFPVSVFGLFTLPNLIASGAAPGKTFERAHDLIGYALIAVISGHAVAALYHHFVRKDFIMRRMLPFAGAIAALLLLPALASAANWQIDPKGSSLTFSATENNVPVTGGFEKFSGQIDFDSGHLETSHVHIDVDIGSVTASYGDVAATLKTPDWFSAELFPLAVFDAKNFSKTGANSYIAKGVLTIRDKTVPASLAFTLDASGKDALAKGSTTLKRTAFGIGQGDWAATDTVKDDVTVSFVIKATQE